MFEGSGLVLLRCFVDGPSSCEEIFKDCETLDLDVLVFVGKGTEGKGNLAGFVVARHTLGQDGTDRAGHAAITTAKIKELKKQIDCGTADKRMEGIVATGTTV